MRASTLEQHTGTTMTRPRLGFLGVGWIGRNRLEAIVDADVADIRTIADARWDQAVDACLLAPGATAAGSLEEALDSGIDGLVIATPSALHADQAIAALERGIAVFCQKPLARTARETRRIVDAARTADRLLAVDLSYRFTSGMQRVRALLQGGELGRVYAADLVFHNAYGPDKAWFYDPLLSGGGCVMDLGIHLIDLALWALEFPPVERVTSRLFAQGEPIAGRATIEDHALAWLDLKGGAVARLACSWRLPAGRDAVIGASFYGTGGGVSFHNVGGSFYDFAVDRFYGTRRETLCTPPDAWGGRAAVDWTRRLAAGEGFDPEVERMVDVSAVLDAIYRP